MLGGKLGGMATRSSFGGGARWISAAKAFLLALTLSAVATTASAQQPLPDPSLLLIRNAQTYGVARQADGKLLVLGGGAADYQFISSSPSPTFSAVLKDDLLRLNADDSLDTSFNVVTDEDSTGRTGGIFDIKVFGNFAYVVGNFQSIGGVRRNGLARINLATNAVNTAWDPNPVGRIAGQLAVGSIAMDGSGNLYAFGSLYDIGGKVNVRMAKIPLNSANGAADPAFDGRQVGANFADEILAEGGSQCRCQTAPSTSSAASRNPAPTAITVSLGWPRPVCQTAAGIPT